MLRLGHRRVLLNEPSVSEVAAPFSLDAYSADLKFAGSTARYLFATETPVTLAQVWNAASGANAAISADQTGVTTDWTSIVGSSGEIRIGTLFNQISGAGKWANATQASSSSRMAVESSGGTRYTIGGKTAIFNTAGGTKNLAFGSAQTTGNSWSAVIVCKFEGDQNASGVPFGDSGTYWLPQVATSRWSLTAASPIGVASNYVGLSPYNPQNPLGLRTAAIGVRVKNGLQEIYFNGWKIASKSVAANLPLSATHIGWNDFGSQSWPGEIAEVVVFDSADTDGFLAMQQNAIEFYSAKPLVLTIGDSLTQGYSATNGTSPGVSGTCLQSYPQILRDISEYPVFVDALAGRTTAQVATAAASVNSGFAARHPSDTGKNICFDLSGLNDLASGNLTPAQSYDQKKLLWAQQRAAGFTVVTSTMPGSVNSGSGNLVQQDLEDLNALILSDESLYDGCLRLHEDEHLGYGQHGNTTYFSDGTHFTNTGNARMAEILKSYLDTLT